MTFTTALCGYSTVYRSAYGNSVETDIVTNTLVRKRIFSLVPDIPTAWTRARVARATRGQKGVLQLRLNASRDDLPDEDRFLFLLPLPTPFPSTSQSAGSTGEVMLGKDVLSPGYPNHVS